MDISEPTISQESLGLSPECDNTPSGIIHSDSVDLLATDDATTNASLMATANDTLVAANNALNNPSSPVEQSLHTTNDNKNDNSPLDNRSTNCMLNKTKVMNTKQRTDMTIVEKHPLMPSRSNSGDNDITPDSPITADAFQCNIEQPPDDGRNVEPLATVSADVEPDCHPEATQIDHSGESGEEDTVPMGDEIPDPDESRQKASAELMYQCVKMINRSNSGLKVPKIRPLRKISLTPELKGTDDDSSIDSQSNTSLESDDSDVNDELNVDGGVATFTVTLSDGKQRDIDMKVIEPYKRCLSHGGYSEDNDKHAIMIFSACYLPDRSRTDYNYVMDNLFL